MSVTELNREQLVQLKENYLCQYFDDAENRSPSYGELADADAIVSDALIFDAYAATVFSPDDLF